MTVDSFEEAIHDLVAKKKLPGSYAIRLHYLGNYRQVEPGIVRLADGRHSIRWRERGHKRRETLQGSLAGDVNYARRQLAIRRGQVKQEKQRLPSLGDAAFHLRRVLVTIDAETSKLPPAARGDAQAAYAHGVKAEDALLRALRILDSPGGNWKDEAAS